MNTNCIVKAHTGGLFSLVNCFTTCLDLYRKGIVYPDWTSTAYNRSGGGNLWDYLFEPKESPSSDYDVLEGYPDQWLTYKNVHELYVGDQEWRSELNDLYHQHIKPLPEIKAAAQKFIDENLAGGCYVAALIRSDPHAGEQVNGLIQTIAQYDEAILKLDASEHRKVFLMCGDETTLKWFRDNRQVFTMPAKRSATRATDVFALPQTIDDAKQVLIETLIASQASTLFHPISNISTFCLYANPSIESIYLQ